MVRLSIHCTAQQIWRDPMSRMIFINLPVRNIAASTRFYEGIGFTRNPAFSDDETSCMVLSESIHVMILTHG